MNTDYLADWNNAEQMQRAVFMEELYKSSGRTNGVYTGLWQEFCMKEAGPYCRNMFFERRKAIEEFVKLELNKQLQNDVHPAGSEPFIETFHDWI